MQAAAARDEVVTGAQVQVIRVAQQDLRAERVELAVRDAFHRALRADRHEGGRLHVTVRGRHAAAPREAVGVRELEAEC